MGNWKFQMGVNLVLDTAPRLGPNARISIMDLISAILMLVTFHSQNVGPEADSLMLLCVLLVYDTLLCSFEHQLFVLPL